MQTENKPVTFPPDVQIDKFCNMQRYKFNFHNCEGWIVEPDHPMPGKYWFAVPEWPTAFTDRNGVQVLLDMGFYMVHVNLLGKFANKPALEIMHKMYEFLQQQGFQKKGAFIGMSLGGLYSFRYAQEHPEGVACIYADNPVCDLNYPRRADRRQEIAAAYDINDPAELAAYSPVNLLNNIARARIPVLMLLGMADNVVDPQTNGILFAERCNQMNGAVTIIKREFYAHHPHGMDNPGQILNFIIYNTLKQP